LREKTGKRVDFRTVVSILQDEAKRILDSREDIDGLEVIGIDFTT